MNQETRQCQNCKQSFVIESDDFDFYKKIDVPAPTFCPDCRSARRMIWRNERTLYKRKCDAPGHSEILISMYAPDDAVTMFDSKQWWGDSWDPLSYGRDYDFSKTFFNQFSELQAVVPRPPLVNNKAVNSDYCNFSDGDKNCYLVINGNRCEDCAYAQLLVDSKSLLDALWVTKSEYVYECIDCNSCSRVLYAQQCESCIDSAFIFNCKGLNNCLFCIGLRNVSNYIFNTPVPPEEYKKFINELEGSYKKFQEALQKFEEMKQKYPRRANLFIASRQAKGEYIFHSNNIRYGFDVYNSEHCGYVQSGLKGRDCFDVSYFDGAELSYESTSLIGHNYLFTIFCRDSRSIAYCDSCHASSNLFACVGLRNKQYCILNKQYSKEEYEALVPKIIEHMNTMPYIDKKGRVYKYGEFFPSELSPFAYNETIAQEYYLFNEEQAEAVGYSWIISDAKKYSITKKSEELPDRIKDIDDGIINETIGCIHEGKCGHQCTTAFKIIPEELSFYRQMNLPLPRLCSNCRHYERLAKRNPLRLWSRKCQCSGNSSENGVYQNTSKHQHGEGKCPNEFETSYSPERKEIVYCEQCYNAEVV